MIISTVENSTRDKFTDLGHCHYSNSAQKTKQNRNLPRPLKHRSADTRDLVHQIFTSVPDLASDEYVDMWYIAPLSLH